MCGMRAPAIEPLPALSEFLTNSAEPISPLGGAIGRAGLISRNALRRAVLSGGDNLFCAGGSQLILTGPSRDASIRGPARLSGHRQLIAHIFHQAAPGRLDSGHVFLRQVDAPASGLGYPDVGQSSRVSLVAEKRWACVFSNSRSHSCCSVRRRR